MAGSDRTEQPTSRRLDEARKKGQIARSRHVGEVGGLVAAFATLWVTGPLVMARLGHEVRLGLERAGYGPTHSISAGEVTSLAVAGAAALALTAGPLAVAAAVAVVASQLLQTGFLLSTEALQLNFGRLNPVNGIKQFGGTRGGAETIKALIVIAVLAWIGRGAIDALVADVPRLARVSPVDAAHAGWISMRGLLWKSILVFVTLAAADYLFQRRVFLNSLKMTKQEVKDDLRMTEGSPETKGRVRKVMQESFRRRMMTAVPKATVVITNPTHYAVALEYRRQAMSAPVIVAMGRDLVAQRIKTLAREHGVPTVENKALAQALYKTCDIGDAIPAHLFEAVAEVLAYLIRLKQLAL